MCLFGSVCVSVYVCVWCSDLSRNKFTKITVEAAPLLVTLYRPSLLGSNLGDTLAHVLVCQSVVHVRTLPENRASYLPIGRHSQNVVELRSREASSIPFICPLSSASSFAIYLPPAPAFQSPDALNDN